MKQALWIKKVIEYKTPGKTVPEKYLDFERWSDDIKYCQTAPTDETKGSLDSLVSEYFDGNEQKGDGYSGVRDVLNEFKEYLKKKGSEEYSNTIELIGNINKFITTKEQSLIKGPVSKDADDDGDTIPDSYSNEYKKLAAATEDIKKQIKVCEDDIKSNTASVIITNIEILGIFIAIAFALFGMFNLTTSVATISDVSVSRLLLIVSILALVMFNSVFFLLYAISRFIDKSISMNCSKASNANCSCRNCEGTGKHKWMCKLKNKFPYLLIVNLFCFLGIIASIVLHFVK